jgi:hypothetical protein
MSKTDLSLRLLAILRFTIPSNSSRTLNATEAYDVTSSGITLASAIGTLVDKSVVVKTENPRTIELMTGLSVQTTGAGDASGLGAEKAAINPTSLLGSSATLTVGAGAAKKRQSANIRQKCNVNQTDNCTPFVGAANTLSFTGTSSGEVFQPSLSKNSKATNPNTIFYGGIPVGTGDYKKWQGKYAVLKINTSTGKCVLRIYDA